MDKPCPLCELLGGELVWQDQHCRVVKVEGAEQLAFPGFCRVIWNQHHAEMSDLSIQDSTHLMSIVLAVERVLRRLVSPDKINLASLGNVVPHLHWHIIPRWRDDTHFPAPIWARPNDDGGAGNLQSAAAGQGRHDITKTTRDTVSCATLSATLADELKNLDKGIVP